MKETFEILAKEKCAAQEKLKAINDAIAAMQKLCEHQWEYEGSDSHNDYDKCSVCGKSR